jgi:hypothetical protein
MATGKSLVASGGKKTSTAFLEYAGAFAAWSISTMWSCEIEHTPRQMLSEAD